MTRLTEKKGTVERHEELMAILKARFDKNRLRNEHLEWENIEKKLAEDEKKLWSVSETEKTDGEPDDVGYNKEEKTSIFCDRSQESPKGRRSTCYDLDGLESRKKNKPEKNTVGMAAEMGIELLTPEQYNMLQAVGISDAKTSSWVKTPIEIRKLGGALFCDYRFGQVFLYHNGEESYYAARGFRGLLRV